MSIFGFQIRSTTMAMRPPPPPVEPSKPTVHVLKLRDESQKKITYVALYALELGKEPRLIAKSSSLDSEFGYTTMNHTSKGLRYRLDYSRSYEEYGTLDMDLNFTVSTKLEKGDIEAGVIRLGRDKGGCRDIQITITDKGVKIEERLKKGS